MFPWFLPEFWTQQAAGELASRGRHFLDLNLESPGWSKKYEYLVTHATVIASFFLQLWSSFRYFSTESHWSCAPYATVLIRNSRLNKIWKFLLSDSVFPLWQLIFSTQSVGGRPAAPESPMSRDTEFWTWLQTYSVRSCILTRSLDFPIHIKVAETWM